jgi:hypothetical protein
MKQNKRHRSRHWSGAKTHRNDDGRTIVMYMLEAQTMNDLSIREDLPPLRGSSPRRSMRERSGSAAAGAEHRVARFPRENTMPLFSADCDALKKIEAALAKTSFAKTRPGMPPTSSNALKLSNVED